MPDPSSEPMKPLHWIASAKKDLLGFPTPVVRNVGYALDYAQRGEKSADALPMRGFGGASVLEIRDDFSGDTFRAVYTVRFEQAIYVLLMCCTVSRKSHIAALPLIRKI